jgi:Protein of unknown function (DUF2786)
VPATDGCGRFAPLSGEAGLNRSFCPSEPEFHDVVRRLVAPYELQLAKTKALLDATLPNQVKPSIKRPQPPQQQTTQQTMPKGHARRAIIDRIQKSWALGSNNPNAAEATSAKERALGLMAEHNISTADLGPPPSLFELDPENWDA